MKKSISLTLTDSQAEYLISLVESEKDKYYAIDLQKNKKLNQYFKILKDISQLLQVETNVISPR